MQCSSAYRTTPSELSSSATWTGFTQPALSQLGHHALQGSAPRSSFETLMPLLRPSESPASSTTLTRAQEFDPWPPLGQLQSIMSNPDIAQVRSQSPEAVVNAPQAHCPGAPLRHGGATTQLKPKETPPCSRCLWQDVDLQATRAWLTAMERSSVARKTQLPGNGMWRACVNALGAYTSSAPAVACRKRVKRNPSTPGDTAATDAATTIKQHGKQVSTSHGKRARQL